MSKWTNDLSASTRDFVRFVWPSLKYWCGDGRLEPVESSTAYGLMRDFDVLAGIDAWQMLDGRGYMRGIASRVQWGRKNWGTFTVRRHRNSGTKTEFEKRLTAIQQADEGALYPALTTHGYVYCRNNLGPENDHSGCATGDHGPLLGAAVMHTKTLYEHIAAHGLDQWRPVSNATFYYQYWDELEARGLAIRIWPKHHDGTDPWSPIHTPDTHDAKQPDLWEGAL